MGKKDAVMIVPSVDGGYHVMYAISADGIYKNGRKRQNLKLEHVQNLDEFNSVSIEHCLKRAFESSGKSKYRVYKNYEWYDENGDYMDPQPINLIEFKSGFFGSLIYDYMLKTTNNHNTVKYFNLINEQIHKHSNNAFELIEVFTELDDRKKYYNITIQFKIKKIDEHV